MFIGIYVDDMLLLGDSDMINNTTTSIKKEFELTVKDKLDEYVGSQIEFKNNYLFIHQRRLIEKIEKEFEVDIVNLKSKNTPMISNQKITHPEEDDKNILSVNELRRYQSGVGSLLYLVRNSRPDIGNAVRELSKSMDRSNNENMTHLYNVIRYVVDTKSMGLKFSKIGYPDQTMWWLRCYVDSDWASDKISRKSVSGWIVYIQNNPIAWGSRQQQTISQSSSEAEFIALSDICKEIVFIVNIFEFFGINIKLPVIVKVDNKGAIFIANNPVTKRTKHIHVRYLLVREYVKDGVIMIQFVRSEDNDSDIMTKNTSEAVHSKHRNKMISYDDWMR